MQRTGRKGHAQYRVVVQDSSWAPTSGRVVRRLGSFNPHTKESTIDKEKTAYYLEHGAQPSPRVVKLLKAQKVKLPGWVEQPDKKKKDIKNKEKLRRNRPTEPEQPKDHKSEDAPEKPESPVEETKPDEGQEVEVSEKVAAEPKTQVEEQAEAKEDK